MVSQLDSRIDRVTVYRGAALVRRTAVVDDSRPGEPVRFAGLPLGLEDASVRVAVSSGGLVATGAHVSLVATDVEVDRPDRAELREARIVVERATARVGWLRDELAALGQVDLQPRREREGEDVPPPPIAARLALLDFRREREAELHDQLAQARAEERELMEELRALEARWQRASSDRPPDPDELRKAVDVEVDGEGPATLEVHYLVPGAVWVPTYALSLVGDLTGGVLELRGLVAQRTGEDWSDAELTLATAVPVRWTDLPELPALRIGRRREGPVRPAWTAPPTGAEQLYRDHDRALGALDTSPELAAPAEDAVTLVAQEHEADAAAEVFAELPPPQLPMAMAAPSPARASGPPAPGPSAPPAAAAPIAPERTAVALAPAEPAPVEPARELLDYASLELPPPSDAHRGRLRPSTRAHPDVVGRAAPPGFTLPTACAWPVSDDAFDHAYPVAHSATIPSDAQFHTVSLGRHDLQSTPVRAVVPLHSADVFQQVAVANPLGVPLLEGPADVLVDGMHRATARVPSTDPRARVTIGLGVDEAVKVGRRVRFHEDTARRPRGRRRLVHELTVTLRNGHPHPVTVEVRERVPVTHADDREVEVSDLPSQPPWERWQPDEGRLDGGRRWVVEVPAGGRVEVTGGYVVEIPSDRELAGGNRREP